MRVRADLAIPLLFNKRLPPETCTPPPPARLPLPPSLPPSLNLATPPPVFRSYLFAHVQDTADIAHAILAGIDEDEDEEDENGDGYIVSGRCAANGAGSAQPGETHRYVAILRAKRHESDRVWKKVEEADEAFSGRGDGGWDHIVSSGASVVVTRSFAVMDTGMRVRAGTVCDVIKGNDEEGVQDEEAKQAGGAGSEYIYVRFSHPQPPWAVLVGRLDGMSTELQVKNDPSTVGQLNKK